MLKELRIKNFKSVQDETIQLGRVNVFIGENGCGKSNILEALAFASAAKEDKLDVEGLYSKGIRVAKPLLTFSAFIGKKLKNKIIIETEFQEGTEIIKGNTIIKSQNENDIFSKWLDEEKLNENSIIKELAKSETLEKLSIEKQKIKKLSFDKYIMSKIINDYTPLREFTIYNLSIKALRGIFIESRKEPLGINGENLDIVIASLKKDELKKLKSYNYLISWLNDFDFDLFDLMKLSGLKLGKSISKLYFTDKFLQKQNNVFSAENANEGILHLLFYIVLFISKKTPSIFAIDNIETSLNPHLCRKVMEVICELAKSENKQVLITTHNPAILDGLNLLDDEIRLFEVYRNESGHTKTKRITINPDSEKKHKLSELWMNGYLGAISKNF